MKRARVGSLVLVRWEDIQEEPGWQGVESPQPRAARCESVGWVSSWGARYLVLVRTYGSDAAGTREAGDRLTIIAPCITACEVLREPVSGR